jgi:Galactose oxidase, central domain
MATTLGGGPIIPNKPMVAGFGIGDGLSTQSTTTAPLSGSGPAVAGNQGNAVEELDVYGEVPMARFGHTITLVSKTKVVLFGGATGDTGKYSMTGETYLFNILTKTWSKLNGKAPFQTSLMWPEHIMSES